MASICHYKAKLGRERGGGGTHVSHDDPLLPCGVPSPENLLSWPPLPAAALTPNFRDVYVSCLILGNKSEASRRRRSSYLDFCVVLILCGRSVEIDRRLRCLITATYVKSKKSEKGKLHATGLT